MANKDRGANAEQSGSTRTDQLHSRTAESSSPHAIHRRDVLKMGATILAGGLAAQCSGARPRTTRPKKVIIAGGGITGLSCGYELMKRGHDVVVLEAAACAGVASM